MPASPGPRGFHRGIQRQNVGLKRDFIDHFGKLLNSVYRFMVAAVVINRSRFNRLHSAHA
jgi:hypothetical protein